jgi:transcriptional regulator with XRE-family HTH domain
MTIGEKIKTYRKMRGISQKTLGELAGGINEVTIRKYEAGDRNPKPEQLLKIANALGISINIFMDFDIETVSDVLSLIFKMDEQLDIEFTGKKNKKGEYNPDSVSLKFNNPTINNRLAKWAQTRDLVQKTVDARNEFETEEEYQNEVADMREKADEIKQHLMDSNIVVKKGNDGIVVKIRN